MAKNIEYPFEPRSTSYLRPGQFWGIPLESGGYACGRVIALCATDGKRDSRRFLFGLMDWSGDVPPTEDSLAGCSVLEQRDGHVRTIQETGRLVLGMRPLELDDIQPGLFLSESGGPNCMLMRGYDELRPATKSEVKSLPVFKTAGFNVIRLLAEKHFGGAAQK